MTTPFAPPLSEKDRLRIERCIRESDVMLVRWLTRKLADADTARDIAQSTYLRVWTYAQTEGVDNVQALIFKTAANLAANEFRARRRRKEKQHTSTASTENALDLVADNGPTPEGLVSDRQLLKACLDAIDALPLNVKRAFVMSRFEEKNYREIASELQVSESSVEKYIITALSELRLANRKITSEDRGGAPQIRRKSQDERVR